MSKTTLNIIIALLLVIIPARSSALHPTGDRQLQEVVVSGGKYKLRNLTSRGTRIPGAVSMFTPDRVGCEVGSALSVKRPIEVQAITFDIISNTIKDVTLQISIYRDSVHSDMISQPILVAIPEGEKLTVTGTPTEGLLLEPGEYVVAITFVDCDEEVKRQWAGQEQWDSQTRYKMMKQNITFPLYLKAGSVRNTATEAFEKSSANIGLRVKGI